MEHLLIFLFPVTACCFNVNAFFSLACFMVKQPALDAVQLIYVLFTNHAGSTAASDASRLSLDSFLRTDYLWATACSSQPLLSHHVKRCLQFRKLGNNVWFQQTIIKIKYRCHKMVAVYIISVLGLMMFCCFIVWR